MEEGKKLPLVEEFYTIQGEGYQAGKAAYFIRIGGCDIGCSWCDTKFSWDPDLYPLVETDRIILNARETKAKSVVITGGEPLMYNLDYICRELKKHDIKTFLETSGAYPLSGKWDWICLSPKQNSPPLKGIFEIADELKVIIQTQDDFHWAEKNAANVGANCRLYLQPEWSKYERMLAGIINYVKEHPHWQVSIQAHKFMHIP
ncbi:MAG: 7-carboxy-7-deazaguanine synthase QueE [Bacteroidales bacterium]|nr:MAG: 7-carboxy-7-deazaguanine synthase QueE [Bacteroidales bacterium]